MLTVVTFLFDGWRHKAQGEEVFTAAHANNVAGMYAKHLTVPHRFVCVTDDPTGVECETFDINRFPRWPEVSPPGWNNRASDFFRLDLFTDFGLELGDRVLMTDLDVWVLGNIDHLITGEDFRILSCPYGYCTALYLVTPGARPELGRYDPATWNDECEALKAAGRWVPGSDQSVVNARARSDEATYTNADGVYLVRSDQREIPADACVAMFFGTMKPWVRDDFRNQWWAAGELVQDKRQLRLRTA